ncbi:MAG: RseA family anti-sigma factor [Variovorax sp.]
MVDGDASADEVAQVLVAVAEDDAVLLAWRDYHLVGAVLREGCHSPCCEGSAFVARLRVRLSDEMAPAAPATLPVQIDASPTLPVRAAEAANEPVFRWKMMAGVASMAAAAALGWNWIGGASGGPVGLQLATRGAGAPLLAAASTSSQSSVPTTVLIGNGAPQVMLRDARLDAMLAAHQQASGSAQMPSGFLRSAAFESPSR